MTLKASNYPTVRPSLDLNFAQTERLDPRITFSRSSTSTYVDSIGIIRSAATNQARFGYDPTTGESLGLLLEEESTNLALYSEELKTNWNEARLTILSSGDVGYVSSTAPDGSNPTYWVPTTATNRHQNVFSANAPETSDYTASFFVKADPSGYYRFGLIFGGTDSIFNASTGLVEYGQFNVQPLPNGWYRISHTISSAIGTSIGVIAYILANDGNSSAPGDGTKGMWVWGAQLEASPYPTSYIPTTSSTVTRAADVATVTNSNVYDTDSFTIINQPFGSSAGASELTLFDGPEPIKRVSIYDQNLSQATINAAAKKTDEFWRWRILGSSFALPNFATDGQVTVDWGDGTVETLTTSEHTFSDGSGYHDIGFRLDNGTYFRPFISNNATHKDKVIALGPAPESMVIRGANAFNGCTNLKVFDATIDATADTSFSQAWYNCSNLTGFPLINTSGVTSFYRGWAGCSSLTSFPLIDTSSGISFENTWLNCSSLTSFPLIDTSSGTIFQAAWRNCSSLTSFPLIDTSAGTNFINAWNGCSSLTSFPLIDTSSGTDFYRTWSSCSSLTSFPLIDISSGTSMKQAWQYCSSLTDFPANFFDSWSPASVANQCFFQTWDGCSSLTPASVVNILDSIAASGQSAPSGTGADDKKIDIDWDGTGTPATTAAAAITTLKSRNWEIYLNNVLQ